MNVFKLTLLATGVASGFFEVAHAQNDFTFKNISLQNFNAFNAPSKSWTIVSDATAEPEARDLKVTKGEGALIFQAKNGGGSLATKDEFGDLQLELDFMVSKGASPAIFLMRRYGLSLADSWTKTDPSVGDAGSLVSGPDHVDGTPPLMSVSRAPGLWQHLSLKFRAPKFKGQGQKSTNARFEEVYLNGVLVQQLTSITGPSVNAEQQNETSKGPLALAGSDGAAAFKNIRYRELGQEQDSSGAPSGYRDISNPVILNPEGRPYVLRSFVQYGDRKLTHVVSYGDPSGLNFSYDIKQGAIFQVWRGQFMNVTQMWEERGEPQLAVPLGSVLTLSDAPVVANLGNANDAWPDSASFDDQTTRGYILDKNRSPKFLYNIKGIEVADSISALPDGGGIGRMIRVASPSENLYVRLAESPVIENVSGDLYALNGKSYFIRIDKKYKPLIRQSPKGKELVVKYDAPVNYSIIW